MPYALILLLLLFVLFSALRRTHMVLRHFSRSAHPLFVLLFLFLFEPCRLGCFVYLAWDS
jgi:hypothetical protein